MHSFAQLCNLIQRCRSFARSLKKLQTGFEETGFEEEAGFHNFQLKVRRDAPAAIFGFRDGSGNPESALFQSVESVVSSNFSLEFREPRDEGTGSLLIITIKISTTPYGLVFYIRDAGDFGYQYEHGQGCSTAHPPG